MKQTRKYLPDMTDNDLLLIAAALRNSVDSWTGDDDGNMSASERRLSLAYDDVWLELERRGHGDGLAVRLDALIGRVRSIIDQPPTP